MIDFVLDLIFVRNPVLNYVLDRFAEIMLGVE